MMNLIGGVGEQAAIQLDSRMAGRYCILILSN
jgi:hypothetical protein